MSRKFETASSKYNKKPHKYKKFIGNQSEGQGFADRRKKKIQYEYLKMLKKERLVDGRQKQKSHQMSVDETDYQPHTVDQQSTSSDRTSPPGSSRKDKKHKPRFRKDEEVTEPGSGVNRFTKLTEDFKQRKQIKQMKKEEALNRTKERDTAMEVYSKRKKDKFKKLCKKTHKGQPVMKNQIEYLLQKIEKQAKQT